MLAGAAGVLAIAGCSSSGRSAGNGISSSPATGGTSATAAAGTVSTSRCGTKPGAAATGTPIKLGAIVTDQPGTSFTDIAYMAQAYFSCVNANGGSTGTRGSFSQMGFAEAEIAVHALESVTGSYTTATVNAAFKAVSNFNTGMNCQLWTYGSYPMHIPNNEDYTVTPDNGKMVQAQGCTAVSSVDPQIAGYRQAAGTAQLAPSD